MTLPRRASATPRCKIPSRCCSEASRNGVALMHRWARVALNRLSMRPNDCVASYLTAVTLHMICHAWCKALEMVGFICPQADVVKEVAGQLTQYSTLAFQDSCNELLATSASPCT
eukprot:4902208-Amphidinium_carterae.1